MERHFLFVFTVFLFFISFSESFIEQQTLSEAVATLQQTVNGLQGRVTVLENTCACSMTTPVFMATLSYDIDSCHLHDTVRFDRMKLNQGSAYNNKNGRFRAPVAGVYAFTATLSVQDGDEYHVALVKDTVSNAIGYLLTDAQDEWLQRSTTVFTHLNRNEEVWMICAGTSRIEGDHQHIWEGAADYHSHFSGFLVAADRNTTFYP